MARVSTLGETSAAKLRLRSPTIVRVLIERVTVREDEIRADLRVSSVAAALDIEAPGTSPATIELCVDVTLRRSDRSLRLVHSTGKSAGAPEPQLHLVKLFHKGRGWWQTLAEGEMMVTQQASHARVTKSYITRVVRLNFLASGMLKASSRVINPP